MDQFSIDERGHIKAVGEIFDGPIVVSTLYGIRSAAFVGCKFTLKPEYQPFQSWYKDATRDKTKLSFVANKHGSRLIVDTDKCHISGCEFVFKECPSTPPGPHDAPAPDLP